MPVSEKYYEKYYEIEDECLDRCISIALTQKRFIRSSMKEGLMNRDLYTDLNQELVAAGVEAWRLGYNPDDDFRAICNLANRRLYAFLKSYGFSRQWDPRTKTQGKGYFLREVCQPEDKFTPVAKVADATGFMAWCEDVVINRLGREAWKEVVKWANSRRPEPQGKVAESISILKEELKNDTSN